MQTQNVTQFPATPASEVQNVADYQAGWNDAQAGRRADRERSIYYALGFVDAHALKTKMVCLQ